MYEVVMLLRRDYTAMQAAAASSAAAGMEAATAKKVMAEFRAAITAQVATLEQRLGVDAAQLTQVRIILFLLLHVKKKRQEKVWETSDRPCILFLMPIMMNHKS